MFYVKLKGSPKIIQIPAETVEEDNHGLRFKDSKSKVVARFVLDQLD